MERELYEMLIKLYRSVIWNAPESAEDFAQTIWHDAILSDLNLYIDCPASKKARGSLEGNTMSLESWQQMMRHLGAAWADEQLPKHHHSILILFLSNNLASMEKDVFAIKTDHQEALR